jgi:hypothetical protein
MSDCFGATKGVCCVDVDAVEKEDFQSNNNKDENEVEERLKQ